jgi:hypothetical protein
VFNFDKKELGVILALLERGPFIIPKILAELEASGGSVGRDVKSRVRSFRALGQLSPLSTLITSLLLAGEPNTIARFTSLAHLNQASANRTTTLCARGPMWLV